MRSPVQMDHTLRSTLRFSAVSSCVSLLCFYFSSGHCCKVSCVNHFLFVCSQTCPQNIKGRKSVTISTEFCCTCAMTAERLFCVFFLVSFCWDGSPTFLHSVSLVEKSSKGMSQMPTHTAQVSTAVTTGRLLESSFALPFTYSNILVLYSYENLLSGKWILIYSLSLLLLLCLNHCLGILDRILCISKTDKCRLNTRLASKSNNKCKNKCYWI